MSTINQELKRMQIALPLIQRCWLYVKDNPGSIPSKVGGALNEEAANVSNVLGMAFKRGMMTRGNVPGARGAEKRAYAYSVPSHMKDYELLPMPKGEKKEARPRVVDIKSLQSAPAPAPAAPRKEALDLINTLTIAEARMLYAQLHKMFG
jgi:hypothetical protein